MKKIFNSLLFIMVLTCLSACRSDVDSEIDGNHRSQKVKTEQILKTVRMSFGGDFISESEEPLLRAEDGDVYTAINVFRSIKNDDGTFGDEERYAYGLFKGIDDISVDVVTGFVYRFEATVLIEKEDKVRQYEYSYVEPFRLNTLRDNSSNPPGYPRDDIQKFQYSSYITDVDDIDEPVFIEDLDRKYFCDLLNGKAYVYVGKDYDDEGVYKYPRVKRYYGNLSIFDPEINEVADIPMAYKSFGLKVIVEELPSGQITIEDITEVTTEGKDLLTFPKDLSLSKTEEWEGLYSMNNLLASSETLKLRFTWHKGGDVTETFDSDVVVKPKTKKVLKVKITGTPNYETKGNVTFTMESDELDIEEQEENHDFD